MPNPNRLKSIIMLLAQSVQRLVNHTMVWLALPSLLRKEHRNRQSKHTDNQLLTVLTDRHFRQCWELLVIDIPLGVFGCILIRQITLGVLIHSQRCLLFLHLRATTCHLTLIKLNLLPRRHLLRSRWSLLEALHFLR